MGDVGAAVATGGTAAGGGVTGVPAGAIGGGAGSAGFGRAGVCGVVCDIITGATGGSGADGDSGCGVGAPVCGIRAERCRHMLRSAGTGRCTRAARPGRAARWGAGARAVRCGRPRCVLAAAGLMVPRLAMDCVMHTGCAMSSHSAQVREVSVAAAPLIVVCDVGGIPTDTHGGLGQRTKEGGCGNC